MYRLLLASSLVTAVTAFIAPTPSAAQQSFNIYLGGFVPAGEDSRSRSGNHSDDVLVNNLNFLAFDIEDFNDVTLGGEWLVGLGSRFDAGVGIGIYSEKVPAVYEDLVNEDFTEIEQDLKLRTVPFTFTLRFLPFGRRAIVQPYIGAGVGVFWWRYAETGEFVDFSDLSIFRDTFSDSGGAAGPLVFGGVRVPIGGFDLGGEVRYQSAEGTLSQDLGFSGDKIDLGGFNYLMTFNIRF